jgi:hypothetical protein
MTFPFDGAALGKELVAAVTAYIDRVLAPIEAELKEVRTENAALRQQLTARIDSTGGRIGDVEAKVMLLGDEKTRYRGQFSRAEQYLRNDLVTHSGGLWCALKQARGVAPGEGGDFMLMQKTVSADRVEALEKRLNSIEGLKVVGDIRKAR